MFGVQRLQRLRLPRASTSLIQLDPFHFIVEIRRRCSRCAAAASTLFAIQLELTLEGPHAVARQGHGLVRDRLHLHDHDSACTSTSPSASVRQTLLPPIDVLGRLLAGARRRTWQLAARACPAGIEPAGHAPRAPGRADTLVLHPFGALDDQPEGRRRSTSRSSGSARRRPQAAASSASSTSAIGGDDRRRRTQCARSSRRRSSSR